MAITDKIRSIILQDKRVSLSLDANDYTKFYEYLGEEYLEIKEISELTSFYIV